MRQRRSNGMVQRSLNKQGFFARLASLNADGHTRPIPMQPWCECCVRGKGTAAPASRSVPLAKGRGNPCDVRSIWLLQKLERIWLSGVRVWPEPLHGQRRHEFGSPHNPTTEYAVSIMKQSNRLTEHGQVPATAPHARTTTRHTDVKVEMTTHFSVEVADCRLHCREPPISHKVAGWWSTKTRMATATVS